MLPGVRGRGARPPARCAASAGRGVPREGAVRGWRAWAPAPGAGERSPGVPVRLQGAEGRAPAASAPPPGVSAPQRGGRAPPPGVPDPRLGVRVLPGVRVPQWGGRVPAAGRARFRSRAREARGTARAGSQTGRAGFPPHAPVPHPGARVPPHAPVPQRVPPPVPGDPRRDPQVPPGPPGRQARPAPPPQRASAAAAVPPPPLGPSEDHPRYDPQLPQEFVVLAVGRTACRTRAHRVSLLSLRSSRAPRRAGPGRISTRRVRWTGREAETTSRTGWRPRVHRGSRRHRPDPYEQFAGRGRRQLRTRAGRPRHAPRRPAHRRGHRSRAGGVRPDRAGRRATGAAPRRGRPPARCSSCGQARSMSTPTQVASHGRKSAGARAGSK
ncbi:hypothetical protein SMICM304S_05437 [Streptomyces microflavus]